jgi:hypothetical protein
MKMNKLDGVALLMVSPVIVLGCIVGVLYFAFLLGVQMAALIIQHRNAKYAATNPLKKRGGIGNG